MNLDVIVLHNVSADMLWAYRPRSSKMHHAHTFRGIEADGFNDAANLVWILTNVDSADSLRLEYTHLAEYADQVEAYRRRRNRSLSVGDVTIVMHGEQVLAALAVAAVGHEPVSLPRYDASDLGNSREFSLAWEAWDVFYREQKNARRTA